MKKVIAFEAITLDAAKRTRLDQEYIDELAEAYTSQCEMPPPDIFGAKGDKTYFLADGFNRISAAKKAGLLGLECEIHEGDYEDALLFSAGANSRHGQRPSTADKRAKVTALLKSRRWGSKSDRWIGDTCGVAHSTVGIIRAQLVDSTSCDPESNGERTGRDGRNRKAPKKKTPSDEPKPGEEVFDFQAFFSALNTLRKMIDRMYRIHKLVRADKTVNQDKEWDKIAKLLEAFHEAFAMRWAYLDGKPFPKQ